MSGKLKPSKKLARIVQSKQTPDIEEIVPPEPKLYFSPIKTRGQQKTTKKILKSSNSSNLNDIQKTSSAVDKEKNKNLEIVSPHIPEKKMKWEPMNWNRMLENIQKMRSAADAPVDTMGCEKCSDTYANAKTQRYHKLVALMLSSQTKDQVTFEAMKRLKENGLTPGKIVDIDQVQLEELLKPVSFYRVKAKNLKRTAEILIEKYDSDIPNNVEEMLKLPGVGPKMAHICMNTAWNTITGVDVHVHRIANRIGWVQKPTKQPEKTRQELESWLPKEKWQDVNLLLVGFGQTICTPMQPKCNSCLNKEICPFPKKKQNKTMK